MKYDASKAVLATVYNCNDIVGVISANSHENFFEFVKKRCMALKNIIKMVKV